MPSFSPTRWLAAGLALSALAWSGVAVAQSPAGRPGPPPQAIPLRVLAVSLRHVAAVEALNHVRPLLSPRGTVEMQPTANTVVVRDLDDAITRIAKALTDLDQPPQQVRFDIRVVQAGPKRGMISPPVAEAPLEEELARRLRGLLRYDDFRVLAQAAMSSSEGEQVAYSLGDGYDVSFKLGSIVGDQRVKLEGFKITRKPAAQADKSRRLEPRQLFQATLNLWLDKPFTLVLAQDEARQEALMIAISCRREPAPRTP